MTQTVPVCVIIPALNEASRIGAAIASVRNQTVEAAEIVVVDNGSSDGTAEVALAAGVRVLHEPQRGPAAARNTGIRAATAPWIAFLDADDHWFADRLAATWSARAQRPDVGFVFGDFTVVNEGSGVAVERAMTTVPQYRSLAAEPLDADAAFVRRDALAQALVRGNFISTSSLLVRRDLVVDGGVFYDTSLRTDDADCLVGEDVEWYLRLLRGTDAVVVRRAVVDYVRHGASLAAQNGRVRYGDVRLGELVAASPERYAPGADAGFRSMRQQQLRRAGFDFARDGDFTRARAAFAQAYAEERRPDTGALAVACRCADNAAGRGALALARRTWQAYRRRGSRA